MVGLAKLIQFHLEKDKSFLLSPVFLQLRVKNKEAAHYLLVQYNLRLLAKVAWQYRGRGMDIDDLIVEGTHGLTRAIEGFDPSKGNRFSTYAYNWIRQSIGRSISEHSRVVRLPAHVFEVTPLTSPKS